MNLLEFKPLLVFPPEMPTIPGQQIIKMTFLITLYRSPYKTNRDVIHTRVNDEW
jgi:hypothetical protein